MLNYTFAYEGEDFDGAIYDGIIDIEAKGLVEAEMMAERELSLAGLNLEVIGVSQLGA